MQLALFPNPRQISDRHLYGMLGLLAACCLGLLIFQAFHVPFWQDDYYYLVQARKARLAGESWLTPFCPRVKGQFWRPLSTETYWRFLETSFGGDARIAHLSNLLLHLLAVAGVGWFSATLLKIVAPDKNGLWAGALAAFLYGVHASHITPILWVAAANSFIMVLLAALMFRFCLRGLTARSEVKKTLAFVLVCLCLALALMSKEIAIVLPALAFLLSLLLWPQTRPRAKAWITLLFCVILAMGWLVLRERLTTPSHSAYEFKFGVNIARNAVSLFLFFFNTPREALRFLVVNASAAAAVWAVLCFTLQFAAFALFCYGSWEYLKAKGALLLLAFVLVACAPYFFLNWNSYAYYITIALLAYAIVIALCAHKTRIVIIASCLAIVSSALSWSGNYFLGYPSLLGRAFWAEKQLQKIEEKCQKQPALCSGKVYWLVHNQHKFYGFDVYGLAYRTGIDENQVIVVKSQKQLDRKHPVWVVPTQGDVFVRP